MEGSCFNVARFLVSEFIHDNPNVSNIGINAFDERVNYIARHILFHETHSDVFTESTRFDVSFSIEDFPEDMRNWALAKNIVAIQKTEFLKLGSSGQYAISNHDWSDVSVVLKAQDGQRGAWFLVSIKRGTMLMKCQEDPDQQLIGTLFLRTMGLNSPDSKMVICDSEEGKQLSYLGDEYGLNVRNSSHYILMDRVKGPSYKNLTSSEDDIQLVVNNLEALGELALFDLVLGNFDRFQLESMAFNAGNIMFENGLLRPIDTDCVMLGDNDRDGFIKLALKKIVNGSEGYADKVSQKLAHNLGEGVDSERFSVDKIMVGMRKAIDKIVDFTENLQYNEESFVENCRERGCEVRSFPKNLRERLLYVSDMAKKSNYKNGV